MTEDFAFDIRYWSSYQGDGQKSGAYDFRQLDNETDSLKYTTLQ